MQEWIIDENSIDHNDLLSAKCANKAYPLVRCKDCKHRSKEMYDYYGDQNDKVYVCQINDIAKKPDWFCADGEKKVK